MPEKYTYTVTYKVFEIVDGERRGVAYSGELKIKSQFALTNDDVYDTVVDQENLSWYESNSGYEISIDIA